MTRPDTLNPRAHLPLRHGYSAVLLLMYKAAHGTAPSYLSQLVRVADRPGRRSLRSARTSCLLVPSGW